MHIICHITCVSDDSLILKFISNSIEGEKTNTNKKLHITATRTSQVGSVAVGLSVCSDKMSLKHKKCLKKKRNKAKQSKAKQRKAKQSKAKQKQTNKQTKNYFKYFVFFQICCLNLEILVKKLLILQDF